LMMLNSREEGFSVLGRWDGPDTESGTGKARAKRCSVSVDWGDRSTHRWSRDCSPIQCGKNWDERQWFSRQRTSVYVLGNEDHERAKRVGDAVRYFLYSHLIVCEPFPG
jgi:hypothetical protein